MNGLFHILNLVTPWFFQYWILVADSMEARHLSTQLLGLLEKLQLRQELENPASYRELIALQTLMQRRVNGEPNQTYESILAEVAEYLKLNEKTLPFLPPRSRQKAVQ